MECATRAKKGRDYLSFFSTYTHMKMSTQFKKEKQITVNNQPITINLSCNRNRQF